MSNSDFTNPMHVLAVQGNVAALDKLLKKEKGKINIDAQDGGNQQTMLHVACYEGLFEMAYYLLGKGASVHSRDAQHWTPLHAAAIQDHLKICSLLLTRGADPNAVNNSFSSPLHYIIRSPYREELIEVLDLMIEHGVNLECMNKRKETPLSTAAAKGHTECVRFLLDQKTSVNTANTLGQSPLHVAVESGSKNTVLLLLRDGADVNAKAEMGTPIDIAVREKKDEIAETLKGNNFNASTYTAFQSGENANSQAPAPFIREEHNKFVAKIDTSDSISISGSEEAKDDISIGDRRSALFSKSSSIGLGGAIEPIVRPFPGFKTEMGRVNAKTEIKLSFVPCNYKNWFFHSEHVNFVGKMNRKGTTEKFEPLIVSICPEATRYRIIIWSRLGDKQVFYPLPQKLHKWKNGIPPEIKTFIKQQVLEARPKDRELEFELEMVKEDDKLFKDQLLEFEIYDPLRAKCFSVGVLYSKEGQTSEQEMFGNENGSPAFEEFLRFLGDKIPLKGWLGYRGDLDTKTNAAGSHSIFRRWKGFEVMFHVSTLLPFTPDEEQQLPRKRRIGNDIGVIVFQEGGAYTPPIRSQFLNVYYVISPDKDDDGNTVYKFQVASQDGVPEYGPEIPDPPIFAADVNGRDFILTKVLNGLLASLRHPALREKIWCKPKEAYLCGIVKAHASKKIGSTLKDPELF